MKAQSSKDPVGQKFKINQVVKRNATVGYSASKYAQFTGKIKEAFFSHLTGNNFSSIIFTMASSISLSDLATKSFKRDKAALRKDSDLPNLINNPIKNLDIIFVLLSKHTNIC